MRKITLWILMLGLLPFLGIMSCKKEEKVIKIGVLSVLTGEAALYGIPPKQGIELAAEHINSMGGINGKRIKLIIEDTLCDPQIGVNAAKKLITRDKVKVIIGGICSSVTMAVSPLANKNKVILMSPQSAAPQIRDAGDFIFRNWTSSDKEGEKAARLAFSKLGLKKVSVVFVNNDYGVGIKNTFVRVFREFGGIVLMEEGTDEGTADFRTILTKIKSSNSDFVYLATYLKEGARFIVQAKEIGLNMNIIAPDSMHDEELIKIAGEAANGVIVTTIAYDPESTEENIKEFVETFKEKYGNIPNNYAAHGYDAMMILAKAISEVGYDSEKIRDYIYQIKDYPGISGNTTFDSKGDVIKPPRITIIKNGRFDDFE
jgi:branched-chain amino acid transport system substrate-binding protein